MIFDLEAHLYRQIVFSLKTFGPGDRTAGIVAHIRKELDEVEASHGRLDEWIDVVILALDGAWRSGCPPETVIAALEEKQTKNEARTWPDWRQYSEGEAIEHVRFTRDPLNGELVREGPCPPECLSDPRC